MPTFTVKPWSSDPKEQEKQIKETLDGVNQTVKTMEKSVNEPSEKLVVDVVAAEDIPKGAFLEVIFEKDVTIARLKR